MARKANRERAAPLSKILILVALPEEAGYLREAIAGRDGWGRPKPSDNFRVNYRPPPEGRVEVTVRTLEGMGPVEACIAASQSITEFSPTIAMMVGIAGSLCEDTANMGDVVVSTRSKLYAPDKIQELDDRYIIGSLDNVISGRVVVDARDKHFNDSFMRYRRDYIDAKGLQADVAAFIERRNSWGFKLINACILGTDHVVDSVEYRDYLNDKDKDPRLDVHKQTGEMHRVRHVVDPVVAVDMESYGFFRAVQAIGPACLGNRAVVFRGISDLCAGKKGFDGDKNQYRRRALHNAADVALSFIESLMYTAILLKLNHPPSAPQ